jgi:hypothetical protein
VSIGLLVVYICIQQGVLIYKKFSKAHFYDAGPIGDRYFIYVPYYGILFRSLIRSHRS